MHSQQKTVPDFGKEDCIGAIDGIHIPAWVQTEEHARFRNKKGAISQNVLAAVSFDMRFQYILAGWEGSAPDSKVLYSALSRPTNKLPVPEGKYYLVDTGYPNMRGFIAPYRRCRYHLNTFVGKTDPENPRELFNYRHSLLRNVVERTFDVLKARFPILQAEMRYPMKTQVKIVAATCILHNFIRMDHSQDQLFAEYANEKIYELDEEDRRNVSEPYVMGSQRIDRHIATELRENVANEMWNARLT
eukprot:TRINITY_DN2954_c0_g1_i1.p1 TRINITY_DN2954_c0_g1~~TRINITY_DN2954_c0_g1_i1.p1  ORF type:complete len:246 (-),score=33.65 TRINITY_DN2954_c0_g1_i1:94-831(-)